MKVILFIFVDNVLFFCVLINGEIVLRFFYKFLRDYELCKSDK